MEHFFEIFLWMHPGSHSITEKDKIMDYTSWVYTDHIADTTKGGVLFLVVTDIPQ